MTNFEKWIEALRSGRYKQNHSSRLALRLDDGTIAYCCLGVACEMWHESTGQGSFRFESYNGPESFGNADEKHWLASGYNWDVSDSAYMLPDVSSWLFDGLTEEQLCRICGASGEREFRPIDITLKHTVLTTKGDLDTATSMNDLGLKFSEIADIMEKEVLNLGEKKQPE